MGTRARRITLEVAGEDVGAGKTLRGTGDDLDKLGTKLRGVNDDAKKGFDGVEQEADKLGAKLKAAGDKAGDSFASGIESAGSNASDLLASGFDPSAIADTISSGISSIGGKGGKLATAAAGLGVLVAGAFAVGLFAGMETEVATDRLAAQLGGSEWAESMGDVAGALYLDGFGESVGETGAAVKLALQNGLASADTATNAEIESITGRLLTFTDVLEQDMDMATQAVSNMLRTGIAEDGGQAFDILTRGIQQGADRAGDLLETFQEYSTMFRDVGISAQDATGLMVQGLQAGARDADTVADSLKEFAIRAQDGSETSAAGFKAIGLNAADMTAAVAAGGPAARDALDQVLDGLRDMEDPAARNAAAIGLFGTKAEDLGDALFSLDLDTAASGLGTVEGATDQLGSAYDNASSKIETFKRGALNELTLFVGNTVLPKLEQLQAWAQENPTAFRVLAGVIGGVLVAALAAYTIASIAATIATLGWSWPILLVGVAVAALAGIVAVNFGTILQWAKNVFHWVADNWPLLLAILTGPFGLAVYAIVRNWQTIKDGATAAKDWVLEKLGAMVSWVTGLGGKIASAADGMWDGIFEAFRSALNSLIRAWNGLRIPGFSIDISLPGPVPDIGFSWDGMSLPNIPTLHAGGEFRAPRPGGEGLALLRDREVVTTPEHAAAARRGGDTHIHVHVNVAGSVYGVDDLYGKVSTGLENGRINVRGRRL